MNNETQLFTESYLMHYGVKGMKWGVRRARKDDAVSVARRNVKQAGKEYTKAYNKAYNKSLAGYSPIKKHRENNAKRWNEAADKAENLRNAKAQLKAAKKDVKNAKVAQTKSAVKDYSKKYDKAIRSQNLADKKWNEVSEQYKSLGKTKVTRMLNAARGKSAEAKAYNKSYDNWEKTQNLADRDWNEAYKAYGNTGRNRVERILNNAKYDR